MNVSKSSKSNAEYRQSSSESIVTEKVEERILELLHTHHTPHSHHNSALYKNYKQMKKLKTKIEIKIEI
jgi:hypothetical protein